MTQQYQQGCINLVCEDDIGAARTVYVGKNGNDLNSGQSSLEPKLTIAAAIAEAASLLPTSTDRVLALYFNHAIISPNPDATITRRTD